MDNIQNIGYIFDSLSYHGFILSLFSSQIISCEFVKYRLIVQASPNHDAVVIFSEEIVSDIFAIDENIGLNLTEPYRLKSPNDEHLD